MLFSNIAYLNSNFEIEQGFVGVENGYITYVGENDPMSVDPTSSTPPRCELTQPQLAQTAQPTQPAQKPSYDFGERYDGTNKLLLPGLYNAHTHAPMTLLRGYAENLSLHDWLNTRVFPFEEKITNEDAYFATQLALAEMLRFGTVSMTDMYFFNEARINAIKESGIKANLCSGIVCFDERTYEELPNKKIDDELIAQHHNTLDGRLKIELNIHGEYTSTPRVVEAVGRAAAQHGVQTHIHLSETKSEHEECKQRNGGKTPTQYFDALGFFEAPCTAAHCVHTEPSDWDILAQQNVSVVCCPASNMKLASGFAPAPQMLAAGVNVALGTDGVASNNSHNMLRELYLFALLYKGSTGDPTVITVPQALATATINGAHAQGRFDCGSIQTGNRADLVVLDTNQPWLQPTTNVLNNLVFSAQGTEVVLTMVDGAVLFKDGIWTTIDIERAIQQTQKATERIQAQL
ncbi:MAG: amidohydrolase [Coriobacteriales bacterium]|jgi:5-methylthioadenosine/S-adenosylhomocysteine deaminase|nr:amidohydrolase [Coriobacteriales bacterium]